MGSVSRRGVIHGKPRNEMIHSAGNRIDRDACWAPSRLFHLRDVLRTRSFEEQARGREKRQSDQTKYTVACTVDFRRWYRTAAQVTSLDVIGDRGNLRACGPN